MTLGYQILGDADDLLGYVENAGLPNPIVVAWEAEDGRVFLYELVAFNRGLAGMWLETVGDLIPLGTVPPGASITGDVTLRFSDVGYISGPNDSVSSTPFDGIIESGLRMTRALPSSPEAERRVNLDLGGFTISNNDGLLDSIVAGYSVDGRAVRVLLGLETYRYDDFTPVFTGRMVQWGNNLTRVGITVRDESYVLERPMQTDLYDGSGGYNGGADLEGRPRPLCFGKVLNISPPMVNAASLIYQVHSRAIQAVDAVYDRGAAVTPGADYADYASLAAAVVAGGTYATCLALGLFRLGSTPSGLITADVRGDAVGGYVDTTGLIGQRILIDFGAVDVGRLDAYSWSDFTAAITGTIGWWQGTSQITITAAMNAIIGHCGAWWGADPNGYYQVGRIAQPDASMALLVLDYDEEPFDLEVLDTALPGTFPPRYRQRVGYQRNWTPQQDTDLAGSVTAARRQFLAEASRVVASTDLTVQNAFLLATDPEPLETLFDDEAQASALSASLLDLYKQARQTVRIPLSLRGLSGKLGFTVLVTHPRLNGGVPLAMLCMNSTIVADNRTTELVLWG